MKTWMLLIVFAVLAWGTVQGAWYFALRVANAQQPAASSRSLAATLQAIRGDIELYKVQHNERPPESWGQLMKPSNIAGNTADLAGPDFPLGPYMTAIPANPVNGRADVGSAPAPTIGWVYEVNGTQYTVQAVNTAGDAVLTY